jgi:transposase-like protein
MFSIFFLARLFAQEFFRSIRWSNGIYCPICNSRNIKGHGKYKQVLKDTFVNLVREPFNDKVVIRPKKGGV